MPVYEMSGSDIWTHKKSPAGDSEHIRVICLTPAGDFSGSTVLFGQCSLLLYLVLLTFSRQ